MSNEKNSLNVTEFKVIIHMISESIFRTLK